MDTDGSTGEIIFTFDGDAAGQKAALRAFALEEKFVTQTYVAVQPEGLDPCDLRVKHGDAAVRDSKWRWRCRRSSSRSSRCWPSTTWTPARGSPPRSTRPPRSMPHQGPGQVEAVRGRPQRRSVHGRAPSDWSARRPRHAARASGAPVRSNDPTAFDATSTDRQTRAVQAAPRPVRPRSTGSAREALKLAVQWSGPPGRSSTPSRDGVHAARPRGRVRAHRRLRRVGTAGRARLGGGPARGAGRRSPRVRDRASAVELLQVSGEPDEKYYIVVLPGSASWRPIGEDSPGSRPSCSG